MKPPSKKESDQDEKDKIAFLGEGKIQKVRSNDLHCPSL
jgi:hypothetical protein